MPWLSRAWPTSWKDTLPLVGIALEASDNIVLVMEADRPEIANLRIIGASSAAVLAFGSEGDALLGRSFDSLISPDAERGMLVSLRAALIRREKLRGELRCRASDGSPLTLGLHLIPADHPGTGKPHAVIIGRDITQRHTLTQMAADTNELLAAAFLHVHAAVAIAETDGRIRMANPRLHGLLGYGPGELVGRQCTDLLSPDLNPGEQAAIAAHLGDPTEGNRVEVDVRALRKDGTVLEARLSSVAISDRAGQCFRITTLAERNDRPAILPAVAVAGKIQMIGLEEVRTALGPRWPALAERVMATAEHVLRRRLEPADTIARTADSAFIISFAKATEEEAAFRAAAIGREIRQRLIGEGEVDATAQVTAITAAVDNAGEPQAPSSESSDAADAASPRNCDYMRMLEDHLATKQAGLKQQAQDTVASVVASAAGEAIPIVRANGQAIGLAWAGIGRQTRRQLISACRILSETERGGFDLDLFVLSCVLDLVGRSIIEGGIGAWLFHVDAETMATRHRFDKFSAQLATLDSSLRKSLIPMIDIPGSDVDPGQTLDRIRLLRPMVRAVGYMLDRPDPPSPGLLSSPGTIVAVRAASLAGTVGPHHARLRTLLAATRASKAILLACDVASASQESALRTSGVDLISAVGA